MGRQEGTESQSASHNPALATQDTRGFDPQRWITLNGVERERTILATAPAHQDRFCGQLEVVFGFHHSVRVERGERVDAVRMPSDEAWTVFLREFKLWCASKEAQHLLVSLDL